MNNLKSLILAASLLAVGASATAGVGVSINIGEPGFYGQLDVGGYPPPPVYYAQPVIVQRPVGYVEVAPVYLRVPLGYRQHWSRYCGMYNACGRRVFFVQDSWYANVYAPRYRAGPRYHGSYHDRHDFRGGPGPGRPGDYREERHDDRGPHGGGPGGRDDHGGGRDDHGERGNGDRGGEHRN
jgi:hypothetical protein